MNKDRGFTLVELMVVIAIMSILALITFAQFSTAQAKARDIQRKSDVSSLGKSLQMYFADYGYFPTEIGGANSSDEWRGDFRDAADYVYMKNLPVDNTQNDTYPYCYIAAGGTADKPLKYAVVTRLEYAGDSEARDLTGIYCGTVGYNFMVVSPNTSVEEFDATYGEGGEEVAP